MALKRAARRIRVERAVASRKYLFAQNAQSDLQLLEYHLTKPTGNALLAFLGAKGIVVSPESINGLMIASHLLLPSAFDAMLIEPRRGAVLQTRVEEADSLRRLKVFVNAMDEAKRKKII